MKLGRGPWSLVRPHKSQLTQVSLSAGRRFARPSRWIPCSSFLFAEFPSYPTLSFRVHALSDADEADPV